MKVIGNKSNWDKNVSVEFTLLELQALYDAIGNISYSDIVNIWNDSWNDSKKECPYSSDFFFNLYIQMQEAIRNNGGETLE